MGTDIESGHAGMPQLSKDPSAKKGSNDADNEVADETTGTLTWHEHSRKPSRYNADDNPRENTHAGASLMANAKQLPHDRSRGTP